MHIHIPDPYLLWHACRLRTCARFFHATSYTYLLARTHGSYGNTGFHVVPSRIANHTLDARGSRRIRRYPSGLHACFGMGSGVSKNGRGGVLRTITKAPPKDCHDLPYVRRRYYEYTRIIIIMFVLRDSILACRTFFSSAEALARTWRAWRRACVLTYRDIHRAACMCIYTYIHTYMHTYMHTHIYAYTYIYIYIHVWTCV